MSAVIVLAPSELQEAVLVGVARHLEALRMKLPDRHGMSGPGWNNHIEGACGEQAFAKWAGIAWDQSVNTFKRGGDVGEIQVRTRSNHEYELIVRDDDRDEDLFVLVTGTAPAFFVRGCIVGGAAKRPEWRKRYGGREPAYFVPHGALVPYRRGEGNA